LKGIHLEENSERRKGRSERVREECMRSCWKQKQNRKQGKEGETRIKDTRRRKGNKTRRGNRR
jgi:hypothetical protein